DPRQERLREALCTLGNGYFATRGAAAESAANGIHYPGTYLAGGYNRLKSEVAGRTIENEDLVNMPNWLPLNFRIEGGEWFCLEEVRILEYRQELDLRRGLFLRKIRFRDKDGRLTSLSSRRMVHMGNPHLAALEVTLTAENWSGKMEICSALDGRVDNSGVERYKGLENKHIEPLETEAFGDSFLFLKVRTNQSDLRVALAARTAIFENGDDSRLQPAIEKEDGRIAQIFHLDVQAKRPVRVEKVVALFTSRDNSIAECGLDAREEIARADHFEDLFVKHSLAWEHLWRRFDVELVVSGSAGANHPELILRLHIFHLLQTTSIHTTDLDVGVPSRGWHGEAYRGHIFWDELFIFPMLNLQLPEITRSLLIYRYRRLNEARCAARAAGRLGAMFPWQSGSNGREESQVLHLNPDSGRWIPDNTHLQRHVSAAIAYNVWQYFEATGDTEFLAFHGAEMMIEISRFWVSMTAYNDELDRYEIHGVMGPDEYHDSYPGAEEPGLTNNAYTNIMVSWLLDHAEKVLDLLSADRSRELREFLDLGENEIALWRKISRRMRIVFHGDGMISQFEDYDRLEELDWDTYREKHGKVMRLDRILEAEGDSVNRYKASKQADVLMLFYLFSFEELKEIFARLGYPFDKDTIPRNTEYYLQRTSHGSTLSQVVHSWVLARSDRPRSWELFLLALQSDVADVQGGTTPEGIHLGAMSGSVDLIQRCYTGIETRHGVLWLNPLLPKELSKLRIQVHYRLQSLEVSITQDEIKVTALRCREEPIRIGFRGEIYTVRESDTRIFKPSEME
ncbi:MAG: glycosyl hydrolase family 65 protein, partial [Opitutales bacterium]